MALGTVAIPPTGVPLADRSAAEDAGRRAADHGPRRGIIWLASYPKSGNTWFRIFLRNLLSGDDGPAALDEIGFAIASSRAVLDDLSGIDSSDMTHDEIDQLRPRVYEQIVDRAEEFPIFMKTHDAYTYLPDGQPLLSRTATAGAIYFLRNPLDVAVSLANHVGRTDFDRTIKRMGSSTRSSAAENGSLNAHFVRERRLDWSGHVRSWLTADVPRCVMRYEDMVARPLETFTAAVRFAGLDYSQQQIQHALDHCRFEKLQQMERENGFRERLAGCKTFFRRGKAGTWREELSPEQVERIIADHGELMQRFGYLPSSPNRNGLSIVD